MKSSPTFKLFPAGTNKKAKSKIFFPDEIAVEKLKNEVSDILEDNSRGISSVKELQIHTVDSLKENKIPVIMLIKGH